MPQLDITTFFSQIFFSFIIFCIFYINIIKWVIPSIYSFLQVRYKILFINSIKFNNFLILTNLINFFEHIKIKNNLYKGWLKFDNVLNKLKVNF